MKPVKVQDYLNNMKDPYEKEFTKALRQESKNVSKIMKGGYNKALSKSKK